VRGGQGEGVLIALTGPELGQSAPVSIFGG